MAEGITLQVEAQKLIDTANNWQEVFGRMDASLAKLEQSLAATRSVLQGEAGDSFRKEVERGIDVCKGKGSEMRQLSEILIQMAGVYQQTEGANKNVFGGT